MVPYCAFDLELFCMFLYMVKDGAKYVTIEILHLMLRMQDETSRVEMETDQL